MESKIDKMTEGDDGDERKIEEIKKIWNKESSQRLNPSDALTNPNFFEEVILKKVREKQNFQEIPDEVKSKEDLERVFDEIFKVFQFKRVSHLLEQELLISLKKNMKKMKNERIERIFDTLVSKLTQYFDIEELPQGRIIKIKKNRYN